MRISENMQKAGMYLLVMLLFACSQPEEHPRGLSGAIVNHDGVTIELTYFQEYFNNNRVVIGIEPDGQGVFYLPLDVRHALQAGLRVGRTEVPLYLRPEDALKVAFDALEPLKSLVFEGVGADNNSFLLAYHRDMDQITGDRFVMSEAGKRDHEAFVALLDSMDTAKLAYLEAGMADKDLSDDFVAFMKTRIIYERYTRMVEYAVMFSRMNPGEPAPELPEDYYSFLEREGVLDDARLENLAYINFLMAWLNHERRLRAAEPSHEEKSINTQTYYLAADVLSGKSRDFIQAMMAGRELSYGTLADAEAIYRDFTEGDAYHGYQERIHLIYRTMEALSAGNPAPAFAMTDMEGREVSLEDFRGKVVFMDFWASWCGPCMREMPHIKAMKERFAKEEEVVFVYVSIDTDEDAWLNAVERLDLEGVHFNTPGRERGVPAMYNVKWIPTFYVIGRDGNIFDNRPPMPSQGGLDEVILAALAE